MDNNITEQSNKYSDDMLVDTTDHPITKNDVQHMSIQVQEILPTTVPDKRENHNIVREKREPYKHRHEDRTDWAETLLSLTDDEIVTNTDGNPETEQKNHEQKENCRHIVNEYEARRPRQRHKKL